MMKGKQRDRGMERGRDGDGSDKAFASEAEKSRAGEEEEAPGSNQRLIIECGVI